MKQRILTAIVALLFFVPLVLYGKWPFILLVFILATIGLIELIKMNKAIKLFTPNFIAVVFMWIVLSFANDFILTSLTKFEFLVLFMMILLACTVVSKNKFSFDHASFLFFSVIYIGVGFYYLIETRIAGLDYILFVLLLIWGTDTGAYFFGRAFGKKKLWPKISPNKTVEGALGGIIVALLVGFVFHIIQPFEYSLIIVLCVSALISFIGQIGDLIASAFKRHYNVKDSGNILPGHGGILDRLDSLLFVLPLIHLIQFVS